MVNVVGVRRNRQRLVVKGGRHSASDGEAGAQIIPSGLGVGRAENIVVLNPGYVDGVEQRCREKTDRDQTDDDPKLALFSQNDFGLTIGC
jgi:hypothetical protein